MVSRDNLPSLVGDYTWEEARDVLLMQLRKCRSEQEFARIMTGIAASIGTAEEINRVRERLGIPLLTDEEIEAMRAEKEEGVVGA